MKGFLLFLSWASSTLFVTWLLTGFEIPWWVSITPIGELFRYVVEKWTNYVISVRMLSPFYTELRLFNWGWNTKANIVDDEKSTKEKPRLIRIEGFEVQPFYLRLVSRYTTTEREGEGIEYETVEERNAALEQKKQNDRLKRIKEQRAERRREKQRGLA